MGADDADNSIVRLSFADVKRTKASYREALECYARMLEQAYPVEAIGRTDGSPVLQATWIAYRSAGVEVSGLDGVLLALGVISFKEKQARVKATTFHPVDWRELDGLFFRKCTGALLEAAGIFLGIAAVASICVALVSLLWGGIVGEWPTALVEIGGGVMGLVLSRFLLRSSLRVRIPNSIYKDKSSPFYLVSIKKTNVYP